jgi:hypothetical protein
VRNLVSLLEGGTKTEGVLEYGAEEDIWAQQGRGNREWRRLHNKELNDLNSSPNIIRVIKSGRMRWAGHVALWGKREMHTGLW